MDINVKELMPHIFSKPIAFHRILAEVAGSVNGGVFLSQAMYWSSIKEASDGWFYKTSEDWEVETFLSRREQETVRRNLVKRKVLEEVKKGIPAKLYFRVNNSALLSEIQKIVQTRMAESAKQESTNPPTTDGGKRQTNTENTTENTTEITKSISFDLEFEEFWAAYPKRPNNPKAVAKTKYVKARSKNVSHETIVNAVRKYAAMRKGEDPKYTAMAVTWLNQRRWEDDEMEQSPPETAAINDSPEFSMLCSSFPVIGNLQAASDAFEAAIRSHANIPEVIECAKKYSLLRKARGKDPAFDISLSRWLKGRLWLDMRDYEFCRTGMNNTLTVRLKKERTKT